MSKSLKFGTCDEFGCVQIEISPLYRSRIETAYSSVKDDVSGIVKERTVQLFVDEGEEEIRHDVEVPLTVGTGDSGVVRTGSSGEDRGTPSDVLSSENWDPDIRIIGVSRKDISLVDDLGKNNSELS